MVVYLGVVVREAIRGANIFKDIFGEVRDIIGARPGAMSKRCVKPEILLLKSSKLRLVC